ncbi:MAG: undecaprenyldiphospho-muramoylpentapeptide beta-N-acetylglucosaminyltransferase [Oscillospiraceae bacterium]|nr:undecaprenyldiphospho-muramoylpentapeptide beta-N-acetylglucosaminyltransferase [Oscillospiraceae bacterium]
MLRVLLAGGGTGGHINPALAIASIIKEHNPDAEFLFAGTPNGMEAKLIPQAGYNFAPIKVSGFQRKPTPKNLVRNAKAAAYLAASGYRSHKIISDFKPDIVIGTGGYVSYPILAKAVQMGIPTVIHEQNAFPGITNRLLAKKVDEVMLTVEEAAQHLDACAKYTVTGLPVRAGFSAGAINRSEAKKQLGLDESLCIFSFGGSLGAGAINNGALALIKWEKDGNLPINHIHGYGKMGKDTFLQRLAESGIDSEKDDRLIVKEYIHNMDVCLAAADLIICRSGASTISELQAMGRASVLIPSPNVTANHQYHNAMVLGRAGAAVVIEEKNLTDELLIEKVKELTDDPEKLNALSKRAADTYVKDTNDRIYAVIKRLIGKE